jgi:hypothetical protein
VWQNAHEWVRLNLQKIVSYYKDVEGVKLDKYLGLTPECYDRGEIVTRGIESWTDCDSLGSLGDMRHAFPETVMEDVSFKRDLCDKQYCCFVSDGDLNMLTDMRSGMGGGQMARNRSGIDTPISGCSFHKIKSIRNMIDGYIVVARLHKTAPPLEGVHVDRVESYTARKLPSPRLAMDVLLNKKKKVYICSDPSWMNA